MKAKKQKKQNINTKKIENASLIAGSHPVFSAISAGKRKIYNIFVTENKLTHLQKVLKDSKKEYLMDSTHIKSGGYITNLIKKDIAHNGIAAMCSTTKEYSIEELKNKDIKTVLVLSNIQNPRNFGAIIRSALAFNVKYILVENLIKDETLISSSTAGAIEHIKIIPTKSLYKSLKILKQYDYHIYSAAVTKKSSPSNLKAPRAAIIIGNEEQGLGPEIIRLSNEAITIPINPQIESLNASVAASILLYQREIDIKSS